MALTRWSDSQKEQENHTGSYRAGAKSKDSWKSVLFDWLASWVLYVLGTTASPPFPRRKGRPPENKPLVTACMRHLCCRFVAATNDLLTKPNP